MASGVASASSKGHCLRAIPTFRCQLAEGATGSFSCGSAPPHESDRSRRPAHASRRAPGQVHGVHVQIIPCRLVSLLLARVSLGGSWDVDNIRQIKQVRELLGFSPPGRALLPCLVLSLEFCHCLACSEASNLEVPGLQRTHHTPSIQMHLNAIHSVRPSLDRLLRSAHGISTARVLRQRTARES